MKNLSISLFSILLAMSFGGRFAMAGKYHEAPALAALVKAGKLPPVEERLPKEPLIVEPRAKDGRIGKYGGVLRRATWDPGQATPTLDLRALLVGKHSCTVGFYPNVAKSYEMRDGGREWIIQLREGLKWSDGHPFTVDDIMFMYEDVYLNTEVSPLPNPQFKSGGEVIKFEKLADYTLRIRAKEPYIIQEYTRMLFYCTGFPKHYLKQFHARYIGKDKASEMAKKMGFVSWDQMLLDRADAYEQTNPDKPSLEPWVLAQAPPDNPVIYRRNPYYWAVDKEGNQLPYIDEMRWDVTSDPEVVKLKSLAGELDFRAIQDVASYPMFKRAEKQGKIVVFRWAESAINASSVEFNLTHKDPVMQAIFRDKRFRFAVSHAIDRQMISELVWLGLGEPWQVAPYETSRFYNERLAHTALEYNPEKANKLLDEMGLDKRDANGWRLRPDGKTLHIAFMAFNEAGLPQVSEIVLDNLKAVGLSANLRIVDLGYLSQQRDANAHDAAIIFHSWGTQDGMFLAGMANHLVAVSWLSFWAPEWTTWYRTGGEKGTKPIPEMLKALAAFEKARTTMDRKQQEKWFKVVTDIAADNLWTIGTVKYPGFTIVTNPKLRNVPRSFLAWGGPSPHHGDSGRPDLWFYED